MNTEREITQKEIKEALARPRDFAYSGDNDEMFITWSLGPVIRCRDSGLLDQSNADAIVKALEERPEFNDEWCVTGCNHWAVGWVDHLSFHAVDEHGNPTPVFRFIASLFDALADYPVLDDDDYCEREHEATLENIVEAGRTFVSDDAPEDWPSDCFGWFWDNDQTAVEASDDQGGYPSDDQIKKALGALGYLDAEYIDEEDED